MYRVTATNHSPPWAVLFCWVPINGPQNALVYGFRLKTPHELELKQAHAIQVEFGTMCQTGEYLVDTFPALNNLPPFLGPWKKVAERHYQAQTSLHLKNMRRAFDNPGWNISKKFRDSAEAADMSVEELAWDLGIMSDAALDTTTMTMDW